MLGFHSCDTDIYGGNILHTFLTLNVQTFNTKYAILTLMTKFKLSNVLEYMLNIFKKFASKFIRKSTVRHYVSTVHFD